MNSEAVEGHRTQIQDGPGSWEGGEHAELLLVGAAEGQRGCAALCHACWAAGRIWRDPAPGIMGGGCRQTIHTSAGRPPNLFSSKAARATFQQPATLWLSWAWNSPVTLTFRAKYKKKIKGRKDYRAATLAVFTLFLCRKCSTPCCVIGIYSALVGFLGGPESKASTCSAGDSGSTPGLGRSPGVGNGTPLQYSCLENPMDGGPWEAVAHGVAKSQTWLHFSLFTFLSLTIMI